MSAENGFPGEDVYREAQAINAMAGEVPTNESVDAAIEYIDRSRAVSNEYVEAIIDAAISGKKLKETLGADNFEQYQSVVNNVLMPGFMQSVASLIPRINALAEAKETEPNKKEIVALGMIEFGKLLDLYIAIFRDNEIIKAVFAGHEQELEEQIMHSRTVIEKMFAPFV